MKVLPYQKFSFHSSLSIREIRDKLESVDRSSGIFGKQFNTELNITFFEVQNNNFQFQYNYYPKEKNLFLLLFHSRWAVPSPRIKGRIIQNKNGISIQVKLYPDFAQLLTVPWGILIGWVIGSGVGGFYVGLLFYIIQMVDFNRESLFIEQKIITLLKR